MQSIAWTWNRGHKYGDTTKENLEGQRTQRKYQGKQRNPRGRKGGESINSAHAPQINDSVGLKFRMENEFEALNLLQIHEDVSDSELEKSCPNGLAVKSSNGPINGNSEYGPMPTRKPMKSKSDQWALEKEKGIAISPCSTHSAPSLGLDLCGDMKFFIEAKLRRSNLEKNFISRRVK